MSAHTPGADASCFGVGSPLGSRVGGGSFAEGVLFPYGVQRAGHICHTVPTFGSRNMGVCFCIFKTFYDLKD